MFYVTISIRRNEWGVRCQYSKWILYDTKNRSLSKLAFNVLFGRREFVNPPSLRKCGVSVIHEEEELIIFTHQTQGNDEDLIILLSHIQCMQYIHFR